MKKKQLTKVGVLQVHITEANKSELQFFFELWAIFVLETPADNS